MTLFNKERLPKGWVRQGGRLRQKDITTYPALLMGKDPYSNQFLATYGQTYLMLAAPPGSGKDVGIVIPNLLQYAHSVVVNDCKFESWFNPSSQMKCTIDDLHTHILCCM